MHLDQTNIVGNVRFATQEYGTECWTVNSQFENKISVEEMRMLRCMCGKTRQDRIKNYNIRERLGVAPLVEKMVKTRLRRFGHVGRTCRLCSKESR